MADTKPLSVDLLRIDGGTQSRVKINDDVVEDYAEIIAAAEKTNWPFPPLDVFHDGTDYYVADGFHRLLAGIRAKRGSVPCIVHKGTAQDARIFGMTANDQHGMRMTRADKRACVEWLLDNGGKITQKEIAEKAGVTTRFVQVLVAQRKPSCMTGKMTPPKRDGKTNSSSTPSGGTQDDSEPPPGGTEDDVDLGKCPVCLGTKWTEDEHGHFCAKCKHTWGEPAGDPDEDRITTQRQKTVKTVEALQRAFDDLQLMQGTQDHNGTTTWSIEDAVDTIKDMGVVRACKALLRIAKQWK